MKTDVKTTFVFRTDWITYFDMLSSDDSNKCLHIIKNYVEELIEPLDTDMSDKLLMVWLFIKNQLDKDIEKYNEKCEINKENGKKGGRPKSSKTNGNRKNQTVFKKANVFSKTETNHDNEYDNDYDNNHDIKTIINNYFNNKKESIKEKVYEHLKIRKKLKAQNTPRAIKLLLKDLDGKDEIEQSIMIDNAIKNSWKCYYPLSTRDKSKIKEIVPDWLNKNQEENIASLDDIKKLEARIEGRNK